MTLRSQNRKSVCVFLFAKIWLPKLENLFCLNRNFGSQTRKTKCQNREGFFSNFQLIKNSTIESKINCFAYASKSNQFTFDFRKMRIKSMDLVFDFDFKFQIEIPDISMKIKISIPYGKQQYNQYNTFNCK